MHAVLMDQEESLIWSEAPDPAMGPDEVIIDIHAAAFSSVLITSHYFSCPAHRRPQGWGGFGKITGHGEYWILNPPRRAGREL